MAKTLTLGAKGTKKTITIGLPRETKYVPPTYFNKIKIVKNTVSPAAAKALAIARKMV